MGRVYRATAANTSRSTAVDLFEINVASTKAVRILEVHISQSTEIGDAAEEMVLVSIKEGMTSSGSGGVSDTTLRSNGHLTPAAKGDTAYAGTVETHNTTLSSTGTIVTHVYVNWNLRVPLDIIFTPETVIELGPSTRLAVNLSATLDPVTFGGYIVFEEIG